MGTRLIRPLLITVLSAAALANAQPRPPEGQLDASETLFTVLAALNAAGYDADPDSPANSAIRKQVRDILAAKHLESVEALKKFFAEHRPKDPGADVEPVRLLRALTLEGPPDFHIAPQAGRASSGRQEAGGSGRC